METLFLECIVSIVSITELSTFGKVENYPNLDRHDLLCLSNEDDDMCGACKLLYV